MTSGPTNHHSDSAVERRASLLARSDAAAVVRLAERLVGERGDPVLLSGPEVGMMMLQVREPVRCERFHLGEVVVTRAEVEFCGGRGWSMRVGREPVATLAAAICDAAADAGIAAEEIADLCRATEAAEADTEREEWARLAPTAVTFEELD